MKMLAINGSPRGTGSNTDRILLPFLEGAQEAGAETETIYLKGKRIKYCLGCFTCWTKTPGVCVHDDDMAELLEKMRLADTIIYASPLYIFTVTAQMKTFLDRTIPLLSPYIVKRGDQFIHPRRYEREEPQKLVLISNCGFPERHHFSALSEMFRVLTSGPDMDLVASMLCAGGELLSQDALRDHVQWYVDAARRAGNEVVSQGAITPETQEVLDRPMSDPQTYSQMANAHWDSVIVTGPESGSISTDEEPGSPLPPPVARETMRDTVAGMAMIFNPEAAGAGTENALNATVQFQVTGAEPGEYYLKIADGTCRAFEGAHPSPKLTIHTPSEVWLAISSGELDGAKSMMEGKYRIEGDLGLLMRFNELFPTETAEENEQSDASETPPGDAGPGTPLPPPTSLDTMRDTVAGMAMIFDAEAAGEDLEAVIQFRVTGAEPGQYYLRIAEGKCAAFEGAHPEPTIAINTPSDVWLAISKGEINGMEGYLKKKYTVEGDMGLLLRFDELFPTGDPPAPIPHPLTPTDENSVQRDPLKLGMHWLMVGFVPWIFHWVTVDMPGLGAGVSIGLPLLLGLLLWGYRRAYGLPVWFETGAPVYFGVAGLVTLLGNNFFISSGHVIANLVMAGIWMSSLATYVPLTANYSKWTLPSAIWTTEAFIDTNAILTAFWSGMFLLMAATALMGEYAETHRTLWMAGRNVLLIPAFIFTAWFQKWYPIRMTRASG